MNDAASVWVLLAAMGFGAFWLCVYSYILYGFGKRLAPRLKAPLAYYEIGFASGPTALLALLVPAALWIQTGIAVTIWYLHFQPIASGFAMGWQQLQHDDHRRFRERAEEWLTEWETPAGMPQEPDRD